LDESLSNIEKCTQAFNNKDVEALLLRYAKSEDAIITTTMNINKILEENQNTYMKLKRVLDATKAHEA